MPIAKSILDIEDELIPDFNQKICSLSKNCEITYWDLSNSESYVFTDGNHLHKASGEEFSKKLANRIKNSTESDCNCN